MKNILLIFCNLIWITVVLSQSSDLSLEMVVDNQIVGIGETVTFTIELTNNGPDPNTGVQVRDRLPSGYDFVSARTTAGVYDQYSGNWNIGRLGNGNTVVLTLLAKVKVPGDYMNLAEVIASDLIDYDSSPNNGVDTDVDGNPVDDPQDEDDGDGQFVVVADRDDAKKNPFPAIGECLAPLDAESSFSPNPDTEINGIFKFDYKIESLINFSGADIDPDYARGDPNQLIMEYYVNSADGSIMFPGGLTGFFKTNLSYSNNDGTIDAAIWLANGQMVSYVYDSEEKKWRAITRESAQTANGRFGNDYLNMMQFFRTAQEMAELPDPLPSYVDWPNSAKGYRAELIESYTGNTNIWNMYFDTAPTPIKTSCIMMGFMVGVLKDARNTKCNRLLIYTKVDIGELTSGESMEIILKSIKPAGITFDAKKYEPLRIDGDAGTAILKDLDQYESRMRSIEIRKQTVERRYCSNVSCEDQKIAELEVLRREKSEVICEMMVKNGMESSMAECMSNEGY